MKNDPLQNAAQPAMTTERQADEKSRRLDLPGQGAEKLAGQMWSNIKAAPSELRSTLTAAFREGAKDLRNFFLDPMGGGTQVEAPGTPLNPTQLEVYEQKHSEEPKQELSVRGNIAPEPPPKERWRAPIESPSPERTRERG